MRSVSFLVKFSLVVQLLSAEMPEMQQHYMFELCYPAVK